VIRFHPFVYDDVIRSRPFDVVSTTLLPKSWYSILDSSEVDLIARSRSKSIPEFGSATLRKYVVAYRDI